MTGAELLKPIASAAPVVELVTREQAAHRAYERAVDRYRRLEAEAKGTFDELLTAQKLLREVGVTADVEMSPAMAAAWVEHRSRKGPA